MAFKMKQSPIKNSLGNFFKNVFSKKKGEGADLRRTKQIEKNKGTEYEGMTNFQKKREKEKTFKKERKESESRFQYDTRKNQEARKRTKNAAKQAAASSIEGEMDLTKKNKSIVRIPTSFGDSKKGQFLKESLTSRVPETKLTFKQAFAAARKDNKDKFVFDGKPYTTKLAEKKNPPPPPDIIEEEKILQAVPRVNRDENLINDKKITEENNFNFDKTNDYSYSPVNKKSPSKKRGYKMKRK